MTQKLLFKYELVRMNGCMFWNETYISYVENTLLCATKVVTNSVDSLRRKWSPFLAYFPYFEKIKVSLWDHHAVCVSVICVSVYLPHQLLNVSTNLYETWSVYHDNWAHLNGVLHKSFPSVCVCMCPTIVARQGLSKSVTAAMNTHATIEKLLEVSFSVRSVSYQTKVGD
jgi:hypothetical protein